MSTLTFADTHNMVAFLENPAESDGFHEIIDFMNANQIHYALTVNPIIYTSCIEQFWAIAKANTINGEPNAGGIDCLPTATIFEELAWLGKGSKRWKGKKKSRTTELQRLRKVGESSKVESSKDKESLGAQEDASKQGRIKIVNETQERLDDAEMFDTDDLHGDEVIVDMEVGKKQEKSAKINEREVSTGVEDSVAPTIPFTIADEGVTAAKIDEITPTSAPTTVIDELTLAQTLIEIKAAKPKAVTTAATTTTTRPKARGVVVQEPSEFRTTTSSPQASQPSKTKDKGKAIMIKPEVPLKRKDQVALDEEMARNLEAQMQVELIEKEKMANKKEEEANIALIESEQEELIDEEKAKLFMEFMERKRKHFAALKAQEKRNRPPTKAQKRNQMSVYLNHMGGYKHNQLKGRKISRKKDERSSNKTEIAQYSSAKKAGDKLESDKSKKQKTDENEEVEEDNEAELKMHIVIVKDDYITIDAIPLATKPPVIGIDREDLETLWKLVKTKHGDTKPEDEHERVLVEMDNLNITMGEYIKLQDDKALSQGETFNWQTTTYGKMEYCEDEDDCFTNFETKFPAIVLDNTLTSDAAISCGPTVSPLNDNEIDFRISFDESDDEDYTVVYDKNSFSYKIFFVNNLKTDSENDNDKVHMPSFPSPEPEVNYFNDLDLFKDFENEFPAIVYNDALMSKLDLLTEPTISPRHIDEFDLKDETSLSEYNNNKIDIEQPLGDMSITPVPDAINVDAQSNYEVTCEDKAKRRNSGNKTKTFEETVICYHTPYPAKKIRRISTSSSQEYAYYIKIYAQSSMIPNDCNMDSIGNYILEIILHQQQSPQLLKQKKLKQTQEDHSNTVQAFNVDSLKFDLVVIQNTCSEKEYSNSETAFNKPVKESIMNSKTKDVHAIKYYLHPKISVQFDFSESNWFNFDLTSKLNQFDSKKSKWTLILGRREYKMSKAKERCMTYFCSLHSHLQILSKEDLKGTHIVHGFKRAFMSLFGQNDDTFTSTMFLNVDQLQKQLDKDEFQEDVSMAAFWVMQKQEKKIDTGKTVDADLVITKSSGTESEVQDDSIRSANDTDVDDTDIRPIYDEEPMVKIQEKVFTIAALKNELRKLQGNIVDTKNSSKNMPRFTSNDMVYNYYLEEARKKTQERNKNSKSSVMHTASPKNTTKGSKPKPRSNNQTSKSLPVSKSSCVTITVMPKADHSKNSSSFSDSKHFVCSTCQKCVFNANHDACITKILKEVNSRAKIQSHKTRNSNKLVEQNSHTQKLVRQISTGHIFSQ
ncbi:hypothetical protein Tco_1311266 [Tanacetum coccineum]